ncbi:MAG: hypothetical protein ACP5SA_03090 [Candidatus Micrarchaeia archaeon]
MELGEDKSIANTYRSVRAFLSDNFVNTRILLRLENDLVGKQNPSVTMSEYLNNIEKLSEELSRNFGKDSKAKQLIDEINNISREASYYAAWLRKVEIFQEQELKDAEKIYKMLNERIAEIARSLSLRVKIRKTYL